MVKLIAEEFDFGIGFAFTSDDQIVGVDLDNCVNMKNGKVESVTEEAKTILEQFSHTYYEISPSGTGIKIFGLMSSLPDNGFRHADVEFYPRGRYFTVTGKRLGNSTELADVTEAVEWLTERYAVRAGDPRFLQPFRYDPNTIEGIPPEPIPAGFLDRVHTLSTNMYSRIVSESDARKAGANLKPEMTDGTPSVDRSANDITVAIWLLSSGFKPGVVLSVLMHNTWFVGSKYREVGENYARLTLRNAARTAKNPNFTVDLTSQPYTDFGNAERLIAMHGDNIRYTNENGWYIWNGVHWQEDTTFMICQWYRMMVGQLSTALVGDDVIGEEQRAALNKWIKRSQTENIMKASINVARSIPGITVPLSTFDTSRYFIAFQNGVVDLRSGELYPHERKYHFTSVSSEEYLPNRECPKWKAFLDQIFGGDEELIHYFHKLVGYCLTASTEEQKLFMFYGSGANGKTTVLTVLSHILGNFFRKIPTNSILASRNDGLADQAAHLMVGGRMVVVSEVPAGRRMNESAIKDITGGGEVAVKKLYRDYGVAPVTAKLVIETNHLPRVQQGIDSSEVSALWRRIRIIPFTVTVPFEKQVQGLDKELIVEEGPGIAAWAVRGAAIWYKERLLDTPARVSEYSSDYRTRMDTFGSFLSEALEYTGDKANFVSTGELFRAYKFWAHQNGESPMSMQSLKAVMAERGYKETLVGSRRGYVEYRTVLDTTTVYI
jgi:putative DNA primase/helicase